MGTLIHSLAPQFFLRKNQYKNLRNQQQPHPEPFNIFSNKISLHLTSKFCFLKKFVFFALVFFSLHPFSQQVELTVQTGHSASIQSIAFSPGDDIIASAGDDNKIILWDFLTSKQIGVLLGHTKKITGISYHPTEPIIATSSADSTVKFWDTKTGKCVSTINFKYPVFCVQFHPDGK